MYYYVVMFVRLSLTIKGYLLTYLSGEQQGSRRAIIRCLQQCAEELSDAKATASARMLLLAIQQPEFIVSACVHTDVLSVTHNLSQLLQSVQTHLLGAMAQMH